MVRFGLSRALLHLGWLLLLLERSSGGASQGDQIGLARGAAFGEWLESWGISWAHELFNGVLPAGLEQIRARVAEEIFKASGARTPSDAVIFQELANWPLQIPVFPLVHRLLFNHLPPVPSSLPLSTFPTSKPAHFSLPLEAKESSGIVGIATSIEPLAKHLPKLRGLSHEYSYFGEGLSLRLYRMNCVIFLDSTQSRGCDGRRLRHLNGDMDMPREKTSQYFGTKPFFLLTLSHQIKRIIAYGQGTQVFSPFLVAPLSLKPETVSEQSPVPLALWPFSPKPVDLGEGAYRWEAPLSLGTSIVVITTLSHHAAISTTVISPPPASSEKTAEGLARHIADQIAHQHGDTVPFMIFSLLKLTSAMRSSPPLSPATTPTTTGRNSPVSRQAGAFGAPPAATREYQTVWEKVQRVSRGGATMLADKAYFQAAIRHLEQNPVRQTWYTRFRTDIRGAFEFDPIDPHQITQAFAFGIGKVGNGRTNRRLSYCIEPRRILLTSPCEAHDPPQSSPEAEPSPPAAPTQSIEIIIDGDTLLVKSSSHAPHAVVGCCATSRICSVISSLDGSVRKMRAEEDWSEEMVLMLVPKNGLSILLSNLHIGLEYPDVEMDSLYYFGKKVYEGMKPSGGSLKKPILIAARITAF